MTDNTVLCRELASAEKIELPADTVLLALGMFAIHENAELLLVFMKGEGGYWEFNFDRVQGAE